MPLWRIYHPENAFSDDDKKQIAENVTDIYAKMLPRFYVNVVYRPVPAGSFYLGGEVAADFVRVVVDHIARQIPDDAGKAQFLQATKKALDPFVADRGLRWELHVDETPFDQWTVEGIRPPKPNTPAEQKWKAENRPSPY